MIFYNYVLQSESRNLMQKHVMCVFSWISAVKYLSIFVLDRLCVRALVIH